MVYNDDNIFAKIINKKLSTDIILENEHTIAFHDIAPQAPIHILIIPKALSFLKKFFNTWIRFFIFNFSKSF